MGSLFMTAAGRIGRKQHWIGSILLFVAAVVLVTIISAAGGIVP
jgi:uncharacterized membrane protein YhaH (DUF805 family)